MNLFERPTKSLSVLSGEVSQIDVRSSASAVGSNISISHTMLFRVDNRPARFAGTPNLAMGEQVTLVGYDGAEFRAVVVRNESTGVVYDARRKDDSWLIGCLVVPLGLLLAGLATGTWILSANEPMFSQSGLPSFLVLLFLGGVVGGVSISAFGVWVALRQRRSALDLDRQIGQLLDVT